MIFAASARGPCLPGYFIDSEGGSTIEKPRATRSYPYRVPRRCNLHLPRARKSSSRERRPQRSYPLPLAAAATSLAIPLPFIPPFIRIGAPRLPLSVTRQPIFARTKTSIATCSLTPRVSSTLASRGFYRALLNQMPLLPRRRPFARPR